VPLAFFGPAIVYLNLQKMATMATYMSPLLLSIALVITLAKDKKAATTAPCFVTRHRSGCGANVILSFCYHPHSKAAEFPSLLRTVLLPRNYQIGY
jgi:hypothetical protein